MRLIIRNDADTASSYVANYIVDRINAFSPTPQHPFVLGLPTGSSPLGVYKILVQKYKAGEITFENVVTFNMVSNPPPWSSRELDGLTNPDPGRVHRDPPRPSRVVPHLHVEALLQPRQHPPQ